MKGRYIMGICIAFVLLGAFVSVTSASTIFVPDDHAKIQWAVDNASAGDTIIMRDGTYVENVDVNKSLTIRSENGSANCIVQAAITDFPVLEVTADYVNISGFTVKDATGDVEESGFGGNGIVLNSVGYCSVSDNIAVNNTVGIELSYSNYSLIENNACENNSFGIVLDSANNNTLNSNIFVNNGLFVGDSYNNIVEDNTVNGKPLVYLEGLSDATVTDEDDAGQVILVNCNNITIEGLDLSYTSFGIELWETNDSTISSNIASNNNWAGIFILGSNNIVKDNNASNNLLGIGVSSGLSNDIVSVNNIIENNTVNNNAVENCQGYPCGIGIRLDASHNIVRENRVSGNFIGIGVGSGPDGYILTNNTVSCNHATNNIYGLVFINSSYNVVENNTASNNSRYGVYLSSSSNGTITNNTVKSNNDCGINLWNSSNNTLTNNTANSNNGSRIRICESERNIISNNLALNNSWGISLQYCNNSIIVSNNASFNRGDVKGDGINLGFSNNNTVSNNDASGNIDAGLQIMNSSNNNTITNNSANLNNYCGINVWNSNGNTITANTASSNDPWGIGLTSSSNNIIYVNNFINNSDNIDSFDSTNIWNSTEKITYTYNGSEFENYLGNYWDDYSGSDANSDGIGDTAYCIDSDNDSYPLIEPWENYSVPTADNYVTLNTFRIKGCSFLNDYIPNATEIADIAYQVRIENDVDASHENISNVTLKFEASNITWTSHPDHLTLKTNTTAIWNFPYAYPELDYWADEGFQRVFFGTTQGELVNTEVQVNRTCNQTCFYTKGTQHAMFNITFYNKSVLWFEGAIAVAPDEDVALKILNFNTTLPLNWKITKPNRIDFELNKTLLQLSVPYSIEVDIEVNPSVPLCYKPMFYLGKGLSETKKESYYHVNAVSYSMKPPLASLGTSINETVNWNAYEYDFVRFELEEQKIILGFDTGSGTYPSIFGTHNGTITPNKTITATKLYTYPCVGTGGHTEYARIWNSTWNATATWEGYIGDWHNITFDKTVILLPNKTYNYTIRTGSYPQIIHESPFNATGGEITCTKFTDANGKNYDDWILAIRLE